MKIGLFSTAIVTGHELITKTAHVWYIHLHESSRIKYMNLVARIAYSFSISASIAPLYTCVALYSWKCPVYWFLHIWIHTYTYSINDIPRKQMIKYLLCQKLLVNCKIFFMQLIFYFYNERQNINKIKHFYVSL